MLLRILISRRFELNFEHKYICDIFDKYLHDSKQLSDARLLHTLCF